MMPGFNQPLDGRGSQTDAPFIGILFIENTDIHRTSNTFRVVYN